MTIIRCNGNIYTPSEFVKALQSKEILDGSTYSIEDEDEVIDYDEESDHSIDG